MAIATSRVDGITEFSKPEGTISEHQANHGHGSSAQPQGCCGCGGGAAASGAATAAVTDPVCGMTVDPATSKHRLDHGGQTFHFCSAGCRAKFAADPDGYLKPKAAAPAKAGAIYACPMHPQIRQVGPGSCPICGMALELVEMSAEA